MSLAQCIQKSNDLLTQLFCDTPSPTQRALMKYEQGPLASTPKETEKKRENKLLEKPLHCVFFKEQQAILQVDWEQSWSWMQTAGLRYEIEAAICTAQEQALATNNI
eukprot:4715612-Ditylum_brightwellii.AAC.1